MQDLGIEHFPQKFSLCIIITFEIVLHVFLKSHGMQDLAAQCVAAARTADGTGENHRKTRNAMLVNKQAKLRNLQREGNHLLFGRPSYLIFLLRSAYYLPS